MWPILVWFGCHCAYVSCVHLPIKQWPERKNCWSDANIWYDSENDWWWCNDETRFLESILRQRWAHPDYCVASLLLLLLAKQFVSRVPFNILRLYFFSSLVSENNKKSIALPALRFSLNLILLHTAVQLPAHCAWIALRTHSIKRQNQIFCFH